MFSLFLYFVSIFKLILSYDGLFAQDFDQTTQFIRGPFPNWINPYYNESLLRNVTSIKPPHLDVSDCTECQCATCWDYVCSYDRGDPFCDYCKEKYWYDCDECDDQTQECNCNCHCKITNCPACICEGANLTCNQNTAPGLGIAQSTKLTTICSFPMIPACDAGLSPIKSTDTLGGLLTNPFGTMFETITNFTYYVQRLDVCLEVMDAGTDPITSGSLTFSFENGVDEVIPFYYSAEELPVNSTVNIFISQGFGYGTKNPKPANHWEVVWNWNTNPESAIFLGYMSLYGCYLNSTCITI